MCSGITPFSRFCSRLYELLCGRIISSPYRLFSRGTSAGDPAFSSCSRTWTKTGDSSICTSLSACSSMATVSSWRARLCVMPKATS